MTTAPPTRRRILLDTRPLRHAPYRRLWTSTIVTAVGSQFTAVAVPKQIYDMTGSSAWVGVASLVGLAPLIVFALWGGAIADTVDRRKMLLATNSGIAALMIVFWLQSALDFGSIPLLMGLVAIQQALFGMNMPARTASVARLVPPGELPAALALNSTVMTAGWIAGPLLAGALIPVAGLSLLYLFDALALCVALWAVWRLPALPPLNGETRRANLADVFAGFKYIATHKLLLVSFAADIIAMVFGMPRALFPEMAAIGYPGVGNDFALGLLFAAIPIGSLVGGLLSGTFSTVTRHGLMVVLAVAAWGASIVGFGASNTIWLAVVFLAAAGAADMVSMVFRGTILQTAATDEMRGRMQGVHTVVVAGGPRVADFVHGLAAPAIGAGTTVVVGGALVVALTVGLALAVPSFLTYEGAPRG
ncbi:MFS transporter [Rhizocola hellebori]|uniref:MFS transporter n=1 Tax=Rhizocola hellebori TaxID=1392758 RepID=A0A8J3QF95_9ACTN|nr:MFS transporter [Rhizocola hellebori]GIH08558.1 MFS transporter [Rhizocola hellebori]